MLVIDVFKGLLAVIVFAGSPWAALGVYFGHLYPLNLMTKDAVPRGRGNGILLALLIGLGIFDYLPFVAICLPLFLYILFLATTHYTTLANLISLLSIFILLTVFQGLTPITIAFGFIFCIDPVATQG